MRSCHVKIRANFDMEIVTSKSGNPPASRTFCSAAGEGRPRGANGGARQGWTLRRAGSSFPALSGRQPRVSRRPAGQNGSSAVDPGTTAEHRGRTPGRKNHSGELDDGCGKREGGPGPAASDGVSSSQTRLPSSPCPLGPLGFNFSQHGPTTRPSVERTAAKAFLLPDRV